MCEATYVEFKKNNKNAICNAFQNDLSRRTHKYTIYKRRVLVVKRTVGLIFAPTSLHSISDTLNGLMQYHSNADKPLRNHILCSHR